VVDRLRRRFDAYSDGFRQANVKQTGYPKQ
jgi:hypothetical protein